MSRNWISRTVLTLALTLAATAAIAQQAAAPAPESSSQAAQNAPAGPILSADQKKQLAAMRLAARDQAAIIRNDASLSADQKKAKLKELRASTRAQMKSVLTPEQHQAIAARRAAHKSSAAAKLGLTPEQSAKLKELRASNRQQREAVLKNPSLTNEQKQAQLTQIRAASKAQLASILTPDQLEKFQQMRGGHRHHKLG